jgi:Cu2+-exporting ATPase
MREHICDPLAAPSGAAEHAGHAPAAAPGRRVAAPAVMGHGGHDAMPMAALVADMRNRFLVAAVFLIPDPAVVANRPERAQLHRAGAVRAA